MLRSQKKILTSSLEVLDKLRGKVIFMVPSKINKMKSQFKIILFLF